MIKDLIYMKDYSKNKTKKKVLKINRILHEFEDNMSMYLCIDKRLVSDSRAF